MASHDNPSESAAPLDFSTPEAQDAIAGLSDLILEIRDEAERKNRLYERTLGLAVVPVLVRRGFIILGRRWERGRRSRR